jgi:hypothetical protein
MPLPVPGATEREEHELTRREGQRIAHRLERDLQGLVAGAPDIGDCVVADGHDETGEQLPVGVGGDPDHADGEVDRPQQRGGAQRGGRPERRAGPRRSGTGRSAGARSATARSSPGPAGGSVRATGGAGTRRTARRAAGRDRRTGTAARRGRGSSPRPGTGGRAQPRRTGSGPPITDSRRPRTDRRSGGLGAGPCGPGARCGRRREPTHQRTHDPRSILRPVSAAVTQRSRHEPPRHSQQAATHSARERPGHACRHPDHESSGLSPTPASIHVVPLNPRNER